MLVAAEAAAVRERPRRGAVEWNPPPSSRSSAREVRGGKLLLRGEGDRRCRRDFSWPSENRGARGSWAFLFSLDVRSSR